MNFHLPSPPLLTFFSPKHLAQYCRHLMAAAEEVLKLLDSYWFEFGVFTAKPPPFSNAKQNPVDEIHEEVVEEPINLSRIQTFRVRSLSDHCLSSDPISPNSVLITPKLETILSGKEVQEFPEPKRKQEEIETTTTTTTTMEKRVKERRRKGGSRSLSELEFEELRGFMDLGFVFSEEDKNSSLVSILPGLQRLGRKADNNNGGDEEEEEEEEEDQVKEIHGGGSAAEVSRPYLSEAWDVLDQRKVDISIKKPLTLSWRIPAHGNEMDIKDHLRIWARTVASTVR